MHNIEEELKKKDLNIKNLIDWDNSQNVQQLTLYLKEIQTDLQTKMTQSIQSHILGKQKILNVLNESLPIILEDKKHEILVNNELNNLIEMMEIRRKIDFSLQHLQKIVNLDDEKIE